MFLSIYWRKKTRSNFKILILLIVNHVIINTTDDNNYKGITMPISDEKQNFT